MTNNSTRLGHLAAPAANTKAVTTPYRQPPPGPPTQPVTRARPAAAARTPLIAMGIFVFAGVAAVAMVNCSKEEQPPQTSAALVTPAPEAGQIETVTIASNPTGAAVLLDGAELGKTPYEFKFRDATELQIEMDGYAPTTVDVEPGGELTYVATLEATAKKRRRRVRSASPTPSEPPRQSAAEYYASIRYMGRRARRYALQSHGPRFKNVDQAKTALYGRKVDKQEYKDNIWVLKARRDQQARAAATAYKQGKTNRQQYSVRRATIDRQYQGH